ncbi:hypothetical protein C2G38_2117265, partial [Gigaspora rosea]
MRSLPPRLTSAQKSKVTLSPFTIVTLFAILLLLHPLLPCPALDDAQRKALLEQRLKAIKLEESGKRKRVVISRN